MPEEGQRLKFDQHGTERASSGSVDPKCRPRSNCLGLAHDVVDVRSASHLLILVSRCLSIACARESSRRDCAQRSRAWLQIIRYLSDPQTTDVVYDKIMERANNDKSPQKLILARCVALLKLHLTERCSLFCPFPLKAWSRLRRTTHAHATFALPVHVPSQETLQKLDIFTQSAPPNTPASVLKFPQPLSPPPAPAH